MASAEEQARPASPAMTAGAAAEAAAHPRLAVPAYFAPGPPWSLLFAGAAGAQFAVVNPNSGPGRAAHTAYAAAIRQAQAAGIRVLGYVPTDYGRRRAVRVRGDAERYLAWYVVDGLFFDEVTTACEAQPYYAALFRSIKSKDAALIVALNPGALPSECYMAAADLIVTFEGPYLEYTPRRTAPAWIRNYDSRRFWHIVYATPDAAAMRHALRLARGRRIGHVYITDETLPNPYHRLPRYWSAALRLIARRQLSAGGRR